MIENKKYGFTLIELLVVITIMGILATMGVNTYFSQIQKAKDATRISHLNSMRDALILYNADTGSMLVSGAGWREGGQGWLTYQDGGNYNNGIIKKLADLEYLDEDFTDATDGDFGYMIYYCDSFQEASLSARFESVGENTLNINGEKYILEGDIDSPTTNDFVKAGEVCNGGSASNSIFFRYKRNYAISVR